MSESQEIIFYTGPDGDIRVEVFFQEENLWLSQKRMAELFGVERSVITKHLKNIFQEGELDQNAVCANFAHTAEDGKTYQTKFYHLDAVIAVGYRVNSYQATRFRIWATGVLKEYMIKGFAMDDARLKQGKHWGKDYFQELLERIKEIRASERRFYQKITDIYAMCSVDYDAKAPVTKGFYATVQNKLHFAITGQTAAEIIKNRTDGKQINMGLTSWKNAPIGKILKSDVSVAKNYLKEEELRQLNRIVTMYLDYAELQAERQLPMTMAEWVKRLDAFLQFNEYEILQDTGKVSAKVAKELAEAEFDKFRVIQDRSYESDFDLEVKRLNKEN